MANITLLINSNWSTCSDGNNTGSPPGSSDNIYLNGFSLTLNTAASETYTCALIKACASNGTTFTAGTIVMGAAASQILNANITAGLTTTLLTVTSGKTISVNGTITGGAGGTNNIYGMLIQAGGAVGNITACIGGSGANNNMGVVNAAYSNGVTSIGTATGNAVSSSPGFYQSPSAGTVGTINDAVGGGTGGGGSVGLYCRGTVNNVGTATGGSVSSAYGVITAAGCSIGTITNANGSLYAAGVCHAVGDISLVSTATGGSGTNVNGLLVTGGTVTAVTQAYGGSADGAHGVSCAGGTVTVTSAKGSMTAGAYGAYGVAYQSGICTVNGTDLTGVGGAVGLGSSASKLRMAANTAIGLWDAATGLSQILMPESTGVAASSDVLSGTPKWTGATTPNIGVMPIYMLKTGKI